MATLKVAIALLGAGCGAPETEIEPLRIGLLMEAENPDGTMTVQAAKLAVDGVNERGGLEVGGRLRPVELLVKDTGTTPEGATRATLELINQDRVSALVGSNSSRTAIPEAAIADAAGIPMISPGSTHPQTTAGKPSAFRVTFTDPFQARLAAKFAAEELEATSAAVLYDVASDYSRDIYQTFRRFFEAAGGRLVAAETYVSGEVEFAAQLERIQDLQPEVLFLPTNRVELLPQVRQARAMGIEAALLGVDAWLPETLTGHPELEGAYVTTHWHPSVAATNDRARTFLEDFRQAYGSEPQSFAALTSDACELIFYAIAKAGSDEPRAIRDQLSRIEDFPGVTGPITFRGNGGDPPKPVVIVRIEAGEVVFQQLVSP
jgi:branched-chain amino acid transport system substrate-binding protein